MPLSSSFCVNAEYRSTPKLWNALMKKQYITFTRSSYTGPGISPTCHFLLSASFRFSFKQLFFISELVYAISCHYSETGIVTGLKGQKEMYVICIFLKHTIWPVHTVAEYRCQKELAIKLILERHRNEEQKGGLPWLLVGCVCLGVMPTILVYYFGSCYLSQSRKYYLMINCVKWFRHV